ncbi:MAG: hypothetical protein AAB305_03220 [Candidatus Zixiibacteriota bacterium]
MKRFTLFIVVMALLVATTVYAGKLSVNYLSTEHVYISGGAADGLIAGSKLKVMRGKTVVAELEVVFSAQHSASCRILTSNGTIESGDAVVVVAEAKKPAPVHVEQKKAEKSVIAPVTPIKPSPPAMEPKRSVPGTSIDGSVAFMYSIWNDASAANLDYSQSAVRMSLNTRRLFGTELAFHFRGRTRNDWRRNSFGSTTTPNDWKNQIWEFSFSYEDPSSPVKFYGGRILPQRVSRIGYFDGLLTEVRMSESFRAGLFGGVRPDLLYAENPQSLSIGGGYVALVTRAGDSLVVEQSIAGVGEYHNSVTSRESIALSGRLQMGNRWGINESMEFDINRSWREVRVGSSLALSSVYVSGWMRLNRSARVTATYDNRTNFRTLQNRSIADSVFDDHLYQGARLMVESSIPWHCRLSGSVGMRKRPDRDQPTWSWMGMFRANKLFIDGLSFSSQATAYNGSLESGSMFSTSLNKSIGMASSVGVTYGGYSYATEAVQTRPRNNWVELTAQTDIARHWFLAGWLQNDFGDDMDGLRTQLEIGYRF